MMDKKNQQGLILSALTENGINTFEDFQSWFEKIKTNEKFKVKKTRLKDLASWSYDENRSSFKHESGKFFGITGILVSHKYEEKEEKWTQPIINQAEVGFLGFIAKEINGIIHFLVQAKMEPGNIGLIQISPTIQATKSNFTQVHGGKKPHFVDYFANPNSGTMLFDQLRSEQGTKYLKKRNRNMILLIDEDVDIEQRENFFWLTLGQIQELHKFNNLIHLDCRSILGALPINIIGNRLEIDDYISERNERNLISLSCSDEESLFSLAEIKEWFALQKRKHERKTEIIPLKKVENWIIGDDAIKNQDNKFFDIVGVNVEASSREVASWSQPLIQNIDGGIIGLICKEIRGVLHFLIQTRFEAGLIDSVELAPTVQFTPENYEGKKLPPFSDFFTRSIKSKPLIETNLSDEGGRFYKSQQKHSIIELEKETELEVPSNYKWLTLSQIYRLGLIEQTINIELRTLIYCISFVK